MNGIGALLLSPGCRTKLGISFLKSRSTVSYDAIRTVFFPLAIYLVFTLAVTPNAALGATVGMVTKVENQAQVGNQPAGVGTIVNMNDALRTGPKARLEVTFRDQTKLTLGENATVVIDRYVFNPEVSTGELTLRTSGGALRMATGRIDQMRKKNINVATPAASLGVRGTDLWWGPIEGYFGVLLVSNSRVEVRNRCRAVTIDEAGEGTDITGEGSDESRRRWRCPGKPYRWPPGKVASALSQTSFGFALGPAVPALGAVAVTAVIVGTSQSDSSPLIIPPAPISP